MEDLRDLGAGEAGAMVLMLSDEENLQICELAQEHFGSANLIVKLNDLVNSARFRALGALVVAPTTAMVSLLDHYVRSPSAVSLLLGMEEGQDIIDMEVSGTGVVGLRLRDLRLPDDVLIVSVRRAGKTVSVRGDLQFHPGDLVTAMGSESSLGEVAILFEG